MSNFEQGDRVELIVDTPEFYWNKSGGKTTTSVAALKGVRKGALGTFERGSTDGNADVIWDGYTFERCLVGSDMITKVTQAEWPVATAPEPKRTLRARDKDGYQTSFELPFNGKRIVRDGSFADVVDDATGKVLAVINLDLYGAVYVEEEEQE